MNEWAWATNEVHWIWFLLGALGGFLLASFIYGVRLAHLRLQMLEDVRRDLFRKIDRIGGPRAPAA
jgi:hypothetical protein